MNDRERARYDMFVRVRQFGLDNAADFPVGSVSAVQFGEITTVIDLIEQLGAQQASSFGEARFGFSGKATARENLREEMSEISRTSRSMVYQFPGINLLFRMPRADNDANLLASGRAFYTESGDYADDFIAYGLPATFRNELLAAANAFEQSFGAPGTAIDSQVEATAEIGEAVRRGMIAWRILNGVVKNKYRNDVGKLAAWLSASHIEKAPKPAPEPTPPTP